jgi:iron complex outermembrane receptor protein
MNRVSKMVHALCRTTTAALCTALLLSSSLAGADAQARSITFNLDLPSQDLDTALQTLALASQHKLLYRSDLVYGKTSPALKGTYTAESALKELLAGTDLTFEVTPSSVVLVREKGENKTGDVRQLPPAPQAFNDAETSDPGAAQKTGFWDRFRLAQNEPSSPSDTSSSREEKPSQNSSKNSVQQNLEEIIVTAQKREERLLDVPVPVTAISAQSLVENNQLRLQDYYTRIPGVNFTAGFYGEPSISIRGLSTSTSSNPTVGLMVDDVPYGFSTTISGGGGVPDIDPSDLERIEVLRGPQGTFYGTSSLGGLLKYVTVDPSTAGASGRMQGGISSVNSGNDLGYSLRGSANVPLSETLAVRISGFTRRDPGYIDNIQNGDRDVNRTDADGGRVAALWRPSQAFSLKLSALIQKANSKGSFDVDPDLGDLQQRALLGTGFHSRDTQAYSAILTAKLGRLDLTSLSGYDVDSLFNSVDVSRYFGAPTAFPNDFRTSKFSQEIRLLAPIGQRVEWLVGAFYTDEKTSSHEDFLSVDPATGRTVGVLLNSSFPNTYEEYAAFTNLTFQFSDQFDVQVGARESQFRLSFSSVQSGPFAGGGVVVVPEAIAKANAFTYLLTPRFKISPNLMTYARLASGYRAGGPNANTGLSGVPDQYDPDKTQNYEIGIKGDAFDHAFSFDASGYYIDWKDLQVHLVQGPFSYNGNAGRAKSKGLELSVESRPVAGLALSAWVAWSNAALTEDFPPAAVLAGTYGVSGDRLPNSPRLSGSISLDQEFPLPSGITGFIGGSVTYVGNRLDTFAASAQQERKVFPAYTQMDLRGGAKYKSWAANLFLNNLTDKRGLLGVGVISAGSFIYTQPRTLGVSVSKTFE